MKSTGNKDVDVEKIVNICGEYIRVWDVKSLGINEGISISSLPFVGRLLVEAIVRRGLLTDAKHLMHRLASGENPDCEFAFLPARILMQDYTGIPALVDLAALREHVHAWGGNERSINPIIQTDIVVDHSILVDSAGHKDAIKINTNLERQRNRERYNFLNWAASKFSNLNVVSHGQGIVHQINLERLANLVVFQETDGVTSAYPDSVIGTDSHTTMANGLGILGWGVGGLEAEAIMLGEPICTKIPPIIGVQLYGKPKPGVFATDIALNLTRVLREHNVVGSLIEFYGPALKDLPAADRCTIANMAPEFGAMCAYFPIDSLTIDYMRQTGRDAKELQRIETYYKQQGFWNFNSDDTLVFGKSLHFDLGSVETTVAGPHYPHQQLNLSQLRNAVKYTDINNSESNIHDGDVVIAAITSCTNTSNPKGMLAAGLVASKAVALGLSVPSYVKTSLAPGSQAVTRYLSDAGLLPALELLGFYVVGYGCTTCNGGAGELNEGVADTIVKQNLSVAAVLSGNRNFEGRVHRLIKANYLASPALVVALAIAGTVRKDLTNEPVGIGSSGNLVYLSDIWPSDDEIDELENKYVTPDIFKSIAISDETTSSCIDEDLYCWDIDSTYIQRPPYFDMSENVGKEIVNACALLVLGDNISTDHISPVGAIAIESPAGKYLEKAGIHYCNYNTYGSRRSNHQVMMRGTFANTSLHNELVPMNSGGMTRYWPEGIVATVFDAAQHYKSKNTPLIIIAGKNYGIGSSRDWAARGPWFLGVKVVIAESFERIHRTNLIAMGILPIEFKPGSGRSEYSLTGEETYCIRPPYRPFGEVNIVVKRKNGYEETIQGIVRIDSQAEMDIFNKGGVFPYLKSKLIS
ncbi:aconitate hydratase AcnA [Enterobacter sp. ECC-019]|uniref:aconitate hydratase AcnA n=1 Tax=Enterobacter sp. ECC-019 TaxID=3116478 RepID=UPI00375425AC